MNVKPFPSGLFSDIDLEDLGNGKQTGKINASEQGIWKLSYKNDMIDILVGYENAREFNDVRATDKLVRDLSNKMSFNFSSYCYYFSLCYYIVYLY